MGGTERMAKDRAFRTLRENARATGVVEVNVGRKHSPEILELETSFLHSSADGVDGTSLVAELPADRGVYFESFHGYLNYNWAPLSGWVDEGGKYIHGLRRVLESFSRERLLVILLDDLERESAGTCREVFSFLEVDPEFVPPGLERRHNEARDAMDFEVDADTVEFMKGELRGPTRELEAFLGRDLSCWGLW